MSTNECENFLNVVLYQPEIPQNAGNIARLCACCGANLILIGKLGFVMTDKYMKRAGLDYWDEVNIIKYATFDEFLENKPEAADLYFFTTKGEKSHTDVGYKTGDYLVFGSESKGLPPEIIEFAGKNKVRLPMKKNTRSLNLSNTVAVGVYEAIRQIGPAQLN